MQIEETTVNGMVVTAITGRIDSATAASCESELVARLADGRKAMVLDLAGVDYLSSAGIRALVMLAKRASAGNAAIALARPQEHVRDILKVVGLEDELPAHVDVEAAVRAVS
jgi:anti-anti-sigma factor